MTAAITRLFPQITAGQELDLKLAQDMVDLRRMQISVAERLEGLGWGPQADVIMWQAITIGDIAEMFMQAIKGADRGGNA